VIFYSIIILINFKNFKFFQGEKDMKMKNLAVAALAAVTLSCVAVGFAACNDGDESYYNLSESGTIYYEGEQTVTLSISDTTEEKTTFKESVKTSDITLSGLLVGKTVTQVTYESSTQLSLVLDGKVTATSAEADGYGTITVAKTAMANNAEANCIVRVDFDPHMMVRSYSSLSTANGKTCTSTFELPYGSFIAENVNTDNIIVPIDGVEVTTTLTEEGYLKITVKGYTPYTSDNGTVFNYPVAKISANVTTFNKDLYVYIGSGFSYALAE
jgi:hypothetical protein